MTLETGKIVRKATLNDEQRLRDMQEASLRALGTLAYDRETIESFIAHVGTMDRSMLEDGSVLIFTQYHEIIACGGWTTRHPAYQQFDTIEPKDDGLPSATIRSVYINPAFARLGYGSKMMAMIEDEIFSAGHKLVKLAATANGRPFYERLGYAPSKPIVLKLPCGRIFSGVAMQKHLAQSAWLAA